MNALHHAWAESMFFQLRLVFLLHAAALEQLVVKLLDLQHCQLFQLYISELRNDVVVNGVVVKFFGRISHLRLDINGVPELQPLFECITASLHRIELLAVLDGGTQLILDLCLCSAKRIFVITFPFASYSVVWDLSFPPPLFPPKSTKRSAAAIFGRSAPSLRFMVRFGIFCCRQDFLLCFT